MNRPGETRSTNKKPSNRSRAVSTRTCASPGAVPAGTTLYLPRGGVHSYRNAGATPLKMMVQAIPAGFDTFFARCTAEFNRDGGPDMERIVQISAEHGIYYAQG